KEFVEYVFWYYVLARNAAENKVSAATLFRERTTQFLLRLVLQHARVGMQVNGGRRLGSFDAKKVTLTFARRDIPALLDFDRTPVNRPGYSPSLFDPPYKNNPPAKPFWLHTTEFVDEPLRGIWRRATEAGEAFRMDDKKRLPEGFLDQQLVVRGSPMSLQEY